MPKKRYGVWAFCLFAACLLVAFDQWTKALAALHLKNKPDIILIPGGFKLSYLENFGAAFGILQHQKWLFLIATVTVLALLAALLLKMPVSKRFLPLRITGVFLIAGAAGNLIDRAVNGYVVDFLYFCLIDFPVFNVADCYVTVSVAMAFILICFYYKEDDFSFLRRQKESH